MSRELFEKLLRGEATSEEYVAALKHEVSEALRHRRANHWAFNRIEAERDAYRQALDQVADELMVGDIETAKRIIDAALARESAETHDGG